jgi:hypothetical protein
MRGAQAVLVARADSILAWPAMWTYGLVIYLEEEPFHTLDIDVAKRTTSWTPAPGPGRNSVG